MFQTSSIEKQSKHSVRERESSTFPDQKSMGAPEQAYGNHTQLRMGRGQPAHTPSRPSQTWMQTKLAIGFSTDSIEQEADHVAEQVMNMPQPIHASSAATGSEENNRVGDERADTNFSPRNAPESLASPILPPMARKLPQSPGQALDEATRSFMEPRFESDFGDVRLHIDEGARNLAGSLDADACTIGHDIAFAAGRYTPGSASGKRLIAHELTHVVQQRHSGKAAIALNPAGTLLDQATEVRQKLSSATAADFKPLVKDASDLADKLTTALKTAAAPNPPQGALSGEDARSGLNHIVRGLVELSSNTKLSSSANQKIPFQKAIDIVKNSQDSEIKNAFASQIYSDFFGVDGLIVLGSLTGQKLNPMDAKQNTAQWLDKNTDSIGKIFKKLDDMGLEGIGLKLTNQLLQQLFAPVHDRDVIPDVKGDVSKQTVSGNKIEADCDVYATYAARLMRAEGWQTAGFLVVVTHEKKADKPAEDRDAHAVALVKKANASGGWKYLGLSNDQNRDLSTQKNDEDARKLLLPYALEIYDPQLKQYDAYYSPAGSDGAYDSKLMQPEKNSLTPFESKKPQASPP